jgi:hypothetical protein
MISCWLTDSVMGAENKKEIKMYSVTLDGILIEAFSCKQKAKDYAKWLGKHSDIQDRRLFGHGGIIDILDQADPDVCKYCGICIEDCGCIDNW